MQEYLTKSWEPGEHCSVIAQTGAGKSYLVAHGLLPMWRYTITLDAKGDDPSLLATGRRVRSYPTLGWYDDERFRITPSPKSIVPDFADALDKIYKSKGWTIYIDETRLFTDPRYFGLGSRVERLWLFGRSRGLTVIAGTQAPRWVPAAMYEQPRHFFLGNINDKRAIDRLGEISVDVDTLREIVPDLGEFEFLYVGPRNVMLRTTYEGE